MADPLLKVVLRTPREVAAEFGARSLRVPSDTGQVGLRPRCEPTVLAVEPGLALGWTADGVHFLATAGGLLRCDGLQAVLLTPVAVVGRDAAEVGTRLTEALGRPGADVELRRAIERLQTGILRELREGAGPGLPEPEP
jgi:F0F1-type ATP synthase epsilon subunit